MYIELTEEEYAIFKQLREGGITRNASILQILDTCDSFECVEESGEEEEYDELDMTEYEEEQETETEQSSEV